MTYQRIVTLNWEPGAIYQTELDGWLDDGWEFIQAFPRNKAVGDMSLDQIVFVLGLPKPEETFMQGVFSGSIPS